MSLYGKTIFGRACGDLKFSFNKEVTREPRVFYWRQALGLPWHLPSNAEWQKLIDFVGNETAGAKLKATSGWNDYEGKSGNGTDDFGFSALPGGVGSSGGGFYNVGYYGYWWSATEGIANRAFSRYMNYSSADVNDHYYDKTDLYSVRCVQD